MDRNGDRVKRALAGDSKAFEMLVEEHTPWLLGRLVRRLGSREAAEDILQEALLAAYQQLAALRSPERFGAWLCSIADNKARMWQRRRLTQLNLLDQLEPETPPETGEKEIAGLVRKAMAKLSEPHRDVIVHHYLKGYSYRQTADLLQLRTDTVKSRLQKARKRLHEEIATMAESSTAQTFDLGPEDLAGLRHAARFRSDDPGRPVLQGICLDAGGRIVATNGAMMLDWPSKGLASLPAPVILDSLQSEMVPEAEAATLVLEGESAVLRSPEGDEVFLRLTPGPYVKYQEVFGTPRPVLAVVRSEHLMACVKEIEPFLRDRHEPVNGGWKYMPLVEMRVSSAEGNLRLRTTRDLGFSRTAEESGEPQEDRPNWEHSVSCPADAADIGNGGSFLAGFNHDFLRTIVEALKDAAEEIRIHFGAMEIYKHPPLHFEAGQESRAALLMPCRMDS